MKILGLELEEWQSLDPKEIGAWPIKVRYVVLIASFILGALLYYFIFSSSLIDNIINIREDLRSNKVSFQDNFIRVANLENYKKEVGIIKQNYQLLLKSIPNSSDTIGLIDMLSIYAKKNNIAINSMEPEKSGKVGNFNEIPLSISLSGNYHNVSSFISDMANMDRILNIRDFKIKNTSKDPLLENLEMQMKVVTYWYSDDK